MKSQKRRRSHVWAKLQTRQSMRWHIQDRFNWKAWENRGSEEYYRESFASERSQLILIPNSPSAWIFRLPMEQRISTGRLEGTIWGSLDPPRSYFVWKSQKSMHAMIMLRSMASFCQREKWYDAISFPAGGQILLLYVGVDMLRRVSFPKSFAMIGISQIPGDI